MATQGEYDYFKNIGADGMRHAAHKPWSDAQCGMYLRELGAMMGLMPEGGRLLDMGCGTGWTSVLFAKKGYQVVGQDLVPEAIDAARQLKHDNGLDHLDFVVGATCTRRKSSAVRRRPASRAGPYTRTPSISTSHCTGACTVLFSRHQAGIVVLKK